ncbi:MAG: acyl-CoA dehydrogenase [Myxococcales bacterium]|nr:acyl-CoA dehydrogenase [Myxococcales bacterium]
MFQDDEIFGLEHRSFRSMVRRFAESLAPNAEAWDEQGIFPREVFEKSGELGLLGIRVDPEYGGSGLDWWYSAIYVEELARTRSAGLNMALMVQSDMATPIIAEVGSDELKRSFLAPAVRGEKIAALGISEPSGGSDVAAIRTTARRDGDDYVIDGQKLWITNGTRADFLTLAVRTGGLGAEGVSLLVFPTDAKGYSVGRALKKIGNRCSDTAELSFDGCRVPARFLLGQENQGFRHVMSSFQGERLVAAISTVATMQLALDDAVAYARERRAFGKPLIGHQVWRHRFVEHATAIEAARRLAYHAVDKMVRDPLGATREITMAKLFAGDLAQRVLYDCLQVHGGYGYTTDLPIGRAWTDARLVTIGAGTSEVMKEILAKLDGF